MPTVRPVYCTEDAIKTHLQNIKLPTGVSWDSLAQSAANEVDANLGVRYATPIAANPDDPSTRSTAYWLQNVSSQVAAARLLLSVAAPGSQDSANAYGRYLLGMATAMMNDVISGKVDLAGAEDAASGVDRKITGPTIINQDRYSQVDVFYDNFMGEGIMPGMGVREEGTQWPPREGYRLP